MLLEAVSEEDWLILALSVITTFDWLNDVTDLRHNASANKIALLFTCFAVMLSLNLLIMHDKWETT